MNMNNIVDVNLENFEQLVEQSATPVLVDFWAPWCGPCKALNPILEQVAQEIGNNGVIAKINIDEVRELAQRFGVRGIPMLLLFKDGEIVQNVSDLRTSSSLTEVINSQINGQSIEQTMLDNLADPQMLSMFLMEADEALLIKTLDQNPSLAITPIGDDNILPMSLAIMNQKVDRIEIFRKYGAKPTLNEMLMMGYVDELKAEISGLSHDEILQKIGMPEAEFYANVLMSPQKEMATLLLPDDIDLNLPGQGEQYPILQVALRLPLNELKNLVNKGLKLDIKVKGKTSLQLSVGNLETVKYLLSQGVDPNETDASGRTALVFAQEAAEINPACKAVADYLATI